MTIKNPDFFALESKLKNFQQSDANLLTINNISSDQWIILSNSTDVFKKNIFVFSTTEAAESFYESSKGHLENILYYPGLDSDFYSSATPSQADLFTRFYVLSTLATKKKVNYSIVTTIEALNLKMPNNSFFVDNSITLLKDDIISPTELAAKLVGMGYTSRNTTEEPGTFSNRGEIFDIYPINHPPIRVLYFDDLIEFIYQIDPVNFRTDRSSEIQSISISPSPQIILDNKYISAFRGSIPRPLLSMKNSVAAREGFFERLSSGYLFEDYILFYPLFFKNTGSLLDYVENYTFHLNNYFDLTSLYDSTYNSNLEIYNERLSVDSDILRPDPELFFNSPSKILAIKKQIHFNELDISNSLEQNIESTVDINISKLSSLLDRSKFNSENNQDRLRYLVEFIKDKLRSNKIYIYYKYEASKKEIIFLLENQHIPLSAVSFINKPLRAGFYYSTCKTLLITEFDFFGIKQKKTHSKTDSTNQDLFAEQLSTLQVGDFVIHKNHGVGEYLGIQSLKMGGSTSDFIALRYSSDDKVYVPVYKLHLLQKHASKETKSKLASLKSKKFEAEKSKAKSSVKKLAFDLIKLQAKRKLEKGFAFSPPDHQYTEFELTFPFTETNDQKRAIDSVMDDMESIRPMDRLICGDVGFGKTEIAMRAAFKAVLDHKQVCILVPTTVLAFQHYNTFIKRFKSFAVNIDFISRFKSAKETTEILKKLENGSLDIIIGTHKLLSDKIKFNDLGLIVVDEEQRFGVAHKEKLKLMRESVDNLTLTATPIPRTLQMSFLGIKDLSLIKTAPLRRQSIKTYIIKNNSETIQKALQQELARGGQAFVVHNRVQDIEQYTSNIRELVPDAKVIFAHGQLPERELEKRITDFYNKKYDILIATTIIESGIDIPSANTMIIDRADTFGLSQLHQLRGRIGRSDKKAYAYFVVPNNKLMTDVQRKRLKAIQTYADLGSGFNLATSDLEIRGSGDILGPEQSGHIATVGLELYMELLNDAINDIKGTIRVENRHIEISTQFSSSIPENYISNTGTRLKYYKVLSNTGTRESLKSKVHELIDIYGQVPESFQNFITILETRLILKDIGLSTIKVKSMRIELQFNRDFVLKNPKLQDSIIAFFTQRPKVYKITPTFAVQCLFKERVTTETMLEFSKNIASQIQVG